MLYQGSCHCGRIRFEIEGTIDGAATCNCSICERKGAVMWFVPRERLKLLTPDADAATYTFNRHRIKHRCLAVVGGGRFLLGRVDRLGRGLRHRRRAHGQADGDRERQSVQSCESVWRHVSSAFMHFGFPCG